MERKTVSFNAKVKPIEKINDEFLKCTVYVCALGKNRNLSYISKEAADEALYSLYNIPVVGYMYKGEDGALHMGGHECSVETNEDGELTLKALTVPYGVVPTQDNVHYEDIEEPDGTKKTYIVGECILWVGRYPELMEAVYSDECMFNQSMEINVSDYDALEEDKNYTDLKSYTYSALCLLGRSDDEAFNVEPCFPESRVAANYELSENNEFVAMMDQMKSALAECFATANGDGDGDGDNQGGDDHGNLEGDAGDEDFSYRKQLAAIQRALPEIENTELFIEDFDDEFVYVTKWAPADENLSDMVETYGRYSYTYDEESETATITSEFTEMIVVWLTPEELDSLSGVYARCEELEEYKANREKQDRESEYDAAIGEFADLSGNEEYDAIYENRYSYESIDSLTNACYAVRGKYGLMPKQAKKTQEISVPIAGVEHKENMTAAEKLHAQYGKRSR